MKSTALSTAFLAVAICIEPSCTSQAPKEEKGASTPTPIASAASACVFPTSASTSAEETAWRIFVAASCTSNGKLTWETWTEQDCFNNPTGPGCAAPSAAARRPHASRLALRSKKLGAATPGDCSPMVTLANAPADLKPFVPTNLANNATFCEEVFADPTEAAFIKSPAAGATLTNLTAQVAFAKAGPISFPTSAIEVKADWLPASSVNNAFDCAGNKPAGVFVETIGGNCYALAGIHFSSKLLPNWLWATFEPQNAVTNPNRCNPKLYNACNDPWGSNPATSTGPKTELTPALAQLMAQAKLPQELHNYRLVGAQTAYVDSTNTPIQLGNSFVEFNAQVPPHQASCITCHSYAMVTSSAQENPNFGNFPGTPPIGTPGQAPPPPGGGSWIAQDFSWMLGIMPAKPAN